MSRAGHITADVIIGAELTRIGQPIPMMVWFSAPASGFTEANVTVVNGVVSNFVSSSDGAYYEFDVIPTTIGVVSVEVNHDNVTASVSLGLPYDDNDDGAIGGTKSSLLYGTT